MEKIEIKVNCFNLAYTVECGQCFRWEKLKDEYFQYVGVIDDRVIKIKQDGNKIIATSNDMNGIEEKIKYYFDLNTDYEKIEKKISTIDSNVNKAVKNTTGIRILNQTFFETLISFIISANNNIPRISRSIKEISRRYGKEIDFEENKYYLFPTLDELRDVKEEEFRECGVGFRAKYIKNTVKDILDGKIIIENIPSTDTSKLRDSVMKLQGVGPKVADCILLFSCSRKEVFPVDVWVERVMCNLYFNESGKVMRKKEILDYAEDNFGKYAGIVQQHLFHNVREKMI